MKKTFLSLIFALVLVLPVSVFAADFKTGESINVAKGETAKNLYVAGQSVTIDGNVSKDLAVAGGNSVLINGNIESDLFAVGQNIDLNGNVGSNARIAGDSITISSKITDDLMVAGNTVSVAEDARIGGAGYLAGNTITINGTFAGDIRIAGSNLNIGDSARINGKLIYYGPDAAKISDKAVITGGVVFHKTESVVAKRAISEVIFWKDLIYKVLGSLVFLLLLIYAFPKFTKENLTSSIGSFWRNMGWGIFTLIVIPIIAFISFGLLITAKIGIALLLLYILYLIVASAFVPLMIGGFVVKYLRKEKEMTADWMTAIVGVLIALLINEIPGVGSLFIFLLFLVALGSLAGKSWSLVSKK